MKKWVKVLLWILGIITLLFVLLFVGAFLWNRSYNRVDSFGRTRFRKDGCYEVRCGPYENCTYDYMCPGELYFREWRKGYKQVDVKNCCDYFLKKGNSCLWGGTMKEYNVYCGKNSGDNSLRKSKTYSN